MNNGFGKVFAVVVILAFIGAVALIAWWTMDWIVSALHLHTHHLRGADVVLFVMVCGSFGYAMDLGKKIERLESTAERQWALIRKLQGCDD